MQRSFSTMARQIIQYDICPTLQNVGNCSLRVQAFDTNKDGVLDRTEFEDFVLKFTSGASKQIGTNLFLVCVLIPGLVYATKRILKPVDTVGPLVEKVPGSVFAVGYMLALGAVGLKIHQVC